MDCSRFHLRISISNNATIEGYLTMAGASDKARFYLEQSVPELQELERKKIFTKVNLIFFKLPSMLFFDKIG